MLNGFQTLVQRRKYRKQTKGHYEEMRKKGKEKRAVLRSLMRKERGKIPAEE